MHMFLLSEFKCTINYVYGGLDLDNENTHYWSTILVLVISLLQWAQFWSVAICIPWGLPDTTDPWGLYIYPSLLFHYLYTHLSHVSPFSVLCSLLFFAPPPSLQLLLLLCLPNDSYFPIVQDNICV